uniref:BOS complex subunit TMEM147 n=1 Tax=Oryza punctata TaxID=4537 RepID=A0A0E0KJF7_ORYPU
MATQLPNMYSKAPSYFQLSPYAQVVAHLGRSDLAVACSDAGDDDDDGGGGEDEMTVFHFLNCAALTFGPHVVYYSATPLSEYDTIGTCVKAAVVYLGTALVKLVCLATLLKVPENDSFDPYQELMKIFIGLIDVAGLYFALTQLTHRNISQNHKFQAVGLGWAFADSVLHRLAPLWIGARGLEFTWEYIFQGLEANANLVMTLSLAALGSLMWLRKNKPRTLVPIIYACALLLATMPSITSYLRRSLEWQTPKVVGFELFSSLVMAFISWQLFSACQRPM